MSMQTEYRVSFNTLIFCRPTLIITYILMNPSKQEGEMRVSRGLKPVEHNYTTSNCTIYRDNESGTRAIILYTRALTITMIRALLLLAYYYNCALFWVIHLLF